jgi:hypothetical protein
MQYHPQAGQIQPNHHPISVSRNYGHSLASKEKPTSVVVYGGDHQESELRHWDPIQDQGVFVVREGLAFCAQEDRA